MFWIPAISMWARILKAENKKKKKFFKQKRERERRRRRKKSFILTVFGFVSFFFFFLLCLVPVDWHCTVFSLCVLIANFYDLRVVRDRLGSLFFAYILNAPILLLPTSIPEFFSSGFSRGWPKSSEGRRRNDERDEKDAKKLFADNRWISG